ncbi:hypothetical protein CCP4SC76_3920009 [Gammaproteobacteria bacterium]
MASSALSGTESPAGIGQFSDLCGNPGVGNDRLEKPPLRVSTPAEGSTRSTRLIGWFRMGC